MKTLIIPVAGQSSRYPDMRPKWLLTMPDGSLMIEKSISQFDLSLFKRVVIIALEDHIKKYSSINILVKNLKKNISKKIQIILLKKNTTCQAETVYLGIKKAKVTGGVVIKDSDNTFKQKFEKKKINRISVVNSNKVELIDAKNKSYILTDKLGNVLNIVEKKVISNLFCCGAYEFQSAEVFNFHAKKCLSLSKNVFISDVIFSMLNSNYLFDYIEATNYEDWGTAKEFRNFSKKFYTIFIDFDGCIVENSSKFSKNPWNIVPIKKNVEVLRDLQKKYNLDIILTTSRPVSEKRKLVSFFRREHLKIKEYIFDLMHSKRILINDFANSNPYPSSISINIPRNSEELSNILSSIIKTD
jgi:hypothetical protein